jgi:hypothetical protein
VRKPSRLRQLLPVPVLLPVLLRELLPVPVLLQELRLRRFPQLQHHMPCHLLLH